METDGYELPFADWAPIFSEVYGASWDETWTLYQDYPDCEPIKVHWSLERCSQPLVADQIPSPELSTPAEVMIDVGCGEPTAIGPLFNDDVVQTTIVVSIQPSIELPLWARLRSDEDSEAIVVLTPACGNCTMTQSAVALSQENDLEMGNFSGDYFMHVFTPIGYTGAVGVELSY